MHNNRESAIIVFSMSRNDDDSPRSRVRAAIEHRQPQRVPFSWGLDVTPEMHAVMANYSLSRGIDWQNVHDEVEDILTITPDYLGRTLAHTTDIWGIGRRTVHYQGGSYDEFVNMPLAAARTVADIERHRWPSADQFDFSGLCGKVLAQDPEQRKAHRADILCSGNPLEIYTWMTGLEQMMLNLLLSPEVVHAAMRRITDFFLDMMQRTADAVADLIDIFYFADDLGSQQSLLFSKQTYRELIKPYHAELCTRSKALVPNSRTMFHTDGSVYDLLPELIEAGVQILEAVQTDAAKMEPSRLKRDFGSQLAFHGAISVQQLLPRATAEQVKTECAMLIDSFGAGGGYIAAPSHCIQYGTPPENVFAMLEAVVGEAEFQELCRRFPA